MKAKLKTPSLFMVAVFSLIAGCNSRNQLDLNAEIKIENSKDSSYDSYILKLINKSGGPLQYFDMPISYSWGFKNFNKNFVIFLVDNDDNKYTPCGYQDANEPLDKKILVLNNNESTEFYLFSHSHDDNLIETLKSVYCAKDSPKYYFLVQYIQINDVKKSIQFSTSNEYKVIYSSQKIYIKTD